MKNYKEKNKDSNRNWIVPAISAVGSAAAIGLGVLAYKAKSKISLKYTEMKLKMKTLFEDEKRQKDEEAKIREEQRKEEAEIRAEQRKEEAAIRAEERRAARRRSYLYPDGNNPEDLSDYAPSSVQNLSQIHVEKNERDEYYHLYKNFLSKGDICVLFGPRGGGKTTLAMQLAKELCSGRTLLIPSDNFHVHPQTVLYYDGEHSDRDNVRLFGRGDYSEFNNFILLRNFGFTTPQMWLKDVEEHLRFQHSDAVVFLDNISCIGSTKDANVMREFILNDFRKLQEKLKTQGCILTLVLIAHPNKEGELAGSMNLQNFATTLLEIQKGDQDHMKLHVAKNRFCGDAQGMTFNLVSRKDENDWRYFVIEDDVDVKTSIITTNSDSTQEKHDKNYQLYLQATKLHNEGKTWEKVSEELNISRPTINKLRKTFENSATIEELSQNDQSTVA